ncbi:MAG TPA: HyaD/HybD family hydrogenase maturation endopeptidase [Smithellaceae bacterium]|nr:HyaD/HybD family hydrogenase maturation endopeptidase [Smithellaceae bacterium]
MIDKNFVTILGIGNILLQDEGFGVHFVRWISERYSAADEIKIIDGGTLGYALLDIVSGCRNLIVIDVLKVDDAPGSLYRFNQQEMEIHLPPPTTAHEVTFSDLLFKVELIGESPEVIFLCIVPGKYGDMDMEMTPLMREKFPAMEKLLLAELNRLNVHLEKVAHA